MARLGTTDGSTDNISLGAASALEITGDITVAFWALFNYSTGGAVHHVVGAYNGGSPYTGWGVGFSNPLSYWSNGNGAWRTASSSLNDGAYHHFAMIITGTGAGAGAFYADLAADGTFTQTAPGAYSGTKYLFSRADAAAGTGFAGRIAHLCVWNTALTLDELRTHRNGRVPRGASLKGYYELYGLSTEPDWSGNGNNGTVTGTTIVDHPPIAPPFGFDLGWQGAFTAAAAGRTTRNTRAWPLGVEIGMGWRMNV